MTERSVLMVMDFQEGILEHVGDLSVIEPAVRALGAARSSGIPVMFVRLAFRPGYPEVSERNGTFSDIARQGDAMTYGHPATELHSALERRSDEPVIFKRRVSAFAGSDLEVLLRAADAEALVLAGVATSGVVLSTLRQAADLDYRLTVLADACADNDPEVDRVLKTKVFPRQAAVVKTDEWIASLASAS